MINLSLQWFYWHTRHFWFGVIAVIYFTQFFSLLLDRFLSLNHIDLIEWILTCCVLIVAAKINDWRIKQIENSLNQYFTIPTRFFFLIVLLTGFGFTLIVSNTTIIITYITLLDILFIAFSIINAKLNDWLDGYSANGSRAPLLQQQPWLRVRVILGKVWQTTVGNIYTGFSSTLPAWLMMITARALRIRKEGIIIRCQHEACSNLFENPKLKCNQCNQGDVWTWPILSNPLFVTCSYSQCKHIYPTWQPVAEAVKAGELSFKYDPCQLGSKCQNFGLKESVRYYRIMLVCLDGVSAAHALEKIDLWFGMARRTEQTREFFQKLGGLADHHKRIRLPQRLNEALILGDKAINLRIVLFNPMTNPPTWAGGYDWVVIVPRTTSTQQMEAKFALSRVELPLTAWPEKKPYQPPNKLKRLFYPPKSDNELTSERGIPPKIGIWSKVEFESFIRGIRQ